MEIGNIITISVGTISVVSVVAYLLKFSIERFFIFKEKDYANKLDIKIKEFETKLSQILPERIIIIKSLFKLIIEIEQNAHDFVNLKGDENRLLEDLRKLKNEFYTNEYYFTNNEFEDCWVNTSLFINYGDARELTEEKNKERFQFAKNARFALRTEIPKIKEEFIHEIQQYYLIG
jgi:hypothetical protein